jgi:cytochrome c peroxidase
VPIEFTDEEIRAHRQPRPLAAGLARRSGKPGIRQPGRDPARPKPVLRCAAVGQWQGFLRHLPSAAIRLPGWSRHGARPGAGTRNTPGLLNVRHQRWFGWDGGHDNLWSASLRPILDPREMGGSAARSARLLKASPPWPATTAKPSANHRRPMTPSSWSISPRRSPPGRKPWSRRPPPSTAFARRWPRKDAAGGGKPIPQAARRGLRLFLGRGQCATCHAGPLFSNGEFGDIGVPFFVKPAGVDPGRQGGIKHLLASPYNLLGDHNDDATRDNAVGTRHLRPEHRNFGEFKVPTLRNLTLTAPYMHNGSLASLRDVVRHYSELDEDRLHSDGERISRSAR